jgi:hypothetical protein
MTPNEKSLNYKILDLIENYNFHIKFTQIDPYRPTTRRLQAQPYPRQVQFTNAIPRGGNGIVKNLRWNIYF